MAAKLLILCLAATAVTVLSDPVPNHQYQVSEAVSNFAIKFHKAAAQAAGKQNLVASPFAIQLLLSLYATGTDGNLRQELVDSLQLGDFDKIVERFGGLGRQLSSNSPDVLSVLNRIYVPPFSDKTKENPLTENFYQASRSYDTELKELDFTDTAKAAEVINKWVEEKTHQNIKNAVSPSDIPEETVLALLNVIFFKGHWNLPFNASDTKNEDFHVEKDKTVKKPMMHLNSHFEYSNDEEIGAQFLELRYEEQGFRMVVVLPNEIDGLSSVLSKLETKGLQSRLNRLYYYSGPIDVKFPKFRIDSSLDLNSLLPKVGVSKLFSEGATGLLKSNSVVVSKALQKAFVEVNEEGATAGAFTGAFAVPMSAPYRPPPQIDFHVDRPFYFTILHGDIVLFTGSYVQ